MGTPARVRPQDAKALALFPRHDRPGRYTSKEPIFHLREETCVFDHGGQEEQVLAGLRDGSIDVGPLLPRGEGNDNHWLPQSAPDARLADPGAASHNVLEHRRLRIRCDRRTGRCSGFGRTRRISACLRVGLFTSNALRPRFLDGPRFTLRIDELGEVDLGFGIAR